MENKSKIKIALYGGISVLALSYLIDNFYLADRKVIKDKIVYRVYEKNDFNAITTDPILGLTLIDEDGDGKVDIARSLRTPKYIPRPPSVLIVSGNGKPTLEDQILFDELMSRNKEAYP